MKKHKGISDNTLIFGILIPIGTILVLILKCI